MDCAVRSRTEFVGAVFSPGWGKAGSAQSLGEQTDMTTSDACSMVSPLLTIAIPTWNRAAYLAKNLAQLRLEMNSVEAGLVEIVVSDNCSPDSTRTVVDNAIMSGLPIRYVRNEKNIGWALNFAQCFDLSRGKYVLLFGDDDLFVDGTLPLLLSRLTQKDYGVVCLRPYGFDVDFRQEYPGGFGRERVFRDANQFLVAISRYFTLTSACVFNKLSLNEVDSRQFAAGDLAAFHFVLRAALAAEENLFIDKYVLAGKRQNSSGYEYAEVHVKEMWRILDAHVKWGLSREAIRVIETDKLLSCYPFDMLTLRLSGRGDLKATFDHFASRFGGRWLFTYWVAPIIRLPRPLAIFWGGVTTFIGRMIAGELRRGIKFAWSKVVRAVAGKRPSFGQ